MRPRPLLVLLLLTATASLAQTHKVAKPEQVLRAVAVYEWTGDLAKPTASRLIPVSLFIDNHFEDAGVYLARPVPFALDTGNIYILQSAGIDKSSLELSFARHFEATDAAGDSAYDDGWFGYGRVHTLAPPRPPKPLHALKTNPVLASSKPNTAAPDDPDRPTMIRRNPTPQPTTASSGSTTPATTGATPSPSDATNDPDRPTMKRRDDSANQSNNAPGAADPAADPDRPTLHRASGSSSTDSSVPPDPSDPSDPSAKTTTPPPSTTTTTGTPSNSPTSDASTTTDPDRPTLKHHTPADAAKASLNNLNYNSDALNNDPDRPSLHRGRPTGALTETELPRLTGRPVNIRQMVAVSDAANREPHGFTLAFDDAAQRAEILAKMQTFARAQLAAYITPGTSTTHPTHTTTTGAHATTTTATQHTASSTTHRTTTAKKPTGATIPLLDEDLKAYQLSYGGDNTYIYTAHTDGTGAQLRYVTIVAQMTGLGGGQLQPALQSVTDALHLDRTPALQFIDAVDADATNRASLLFELRAQSSRQFALYRVIAAHADQIFLTGTTQ